MSAMCGSAMNVSVCVCFLDEDWIIITTLNLLATAHTDHCTVRTDRQHTQERREQYQDYTGRAITQKSDERDYSYTIIIIHFTAHSSERERLADP